MHEARNAAHDPEDYFEYIMFAWGNCQAGDRLVMERKLKRFPNEEDLSVNFTPGVRFFFDYEKLKQHPEAVFEGVLPLKIKELRESVNMTRKEFSEHTGIPVRTLEDWEAARRTPPEYIPRLIAYQLKFEELVREKEKGEE